MNTVTFEITKTKTLVTIVGSTRVENVDITDTDIEKDFIEILKKIKEHRDLIDATDIEKFSVLTQNLTT